MNKIKLKSIIYIWAICSAIFLPLQSTLVNTFHLPNFLQPIYFFLLSGCLILFNVPLKLIKKSIDKKFLIIFLILIFAYIISIILNYASIAERGMAFTYYTRDYSTFWNSPTVAPLTWGILNPCIYFLFSLLLLCFFNFKSTIKIIIKTLIIVAFISALYSCYQIIADKLSLPFGSIFSGHNQEPIYLLRGIRRVEGIFFEPGPHAMFLSPIYCILFTQLYENDKKQLLFNRKFILLSFILISIILIFTFSPIGYITMILVYVFSYILKIKKLVLTKKLLIKLSLLFISILLLLLIIYFNKKDADSFNVYSYMIDKIATSTFSMNDPIIYSNPDSRSVRNYVAIQLFKEHPIFGAGPSSGIYYYFKYAAFAYLRTLPGTSAILNTHLQNLSETGIFGFSFYLMLILYPLWYYYKYIKKCIFSNLTKGLLMGYVLMLLLTFQSGPSLFTPYFWLIYSLLFSLERKEKIERNKIL